MKDPEKAFFPGLQIPDWLPGPVAAFAQKKTAEIDGNPGSAEALEILRRLACDPRMRNVWKELQKRKRKNYEPTEDFVHAARPVSEWVEKYYQTGNSPPTPVLRAYYATIYSTLYDQLVGSPLTHQNRAMIYFFDQAFALALTNTTVIPISNFKKRRRFYVKMAQQLRDDAEERTGFGTTALKEAARYYEVLVKTSAPPQRELFVQRKPKAHARLKGFVMELADITKAVFGNPLCGCLATTTNVTFGVSALTADGVRKMLVYTPRP